MSCAGAPSIFSSYYSVRIFELGFLGYFSFPVFTCFSLGFVDFSAKHNYGSRKREKTALLREASWKHIFDSRGTMDFIFARST